MKYLITAFALAALTATPVLAQADAKHGYNSRNHHYQHRPNHSHHNHRHWRNNYNWVAPAIIGGAIAYGFTQPYVIEQAPVIVQEPPVVYQSEPVYNGCSQWRETQYANGIIVRERTCYR